jgi:hypothetical protein
MAPVGVAKRALPPVSLAAHRYSRSPPGLRCCLGLRPCRARHAV